MTRFFLQSRRRSGRCKAVFLACASIVALVGLPLRSQEKPVAKVDRAPEMRLTGNRVSFPIIMVREFPFIEGEVAGVKGKFMLDTGAEQALALNDHRVPLDDGIAVGSGHFGSGQTFQVKMHETVANVRVGESSLPRVTHVQSQDARQLEAITSDFLGWLGFYFWKGYALKLDYRADRVTYYKGDETEYLAGEKVLAAIPFTTRKLPNHPVATVKLGTVNAVAAFDTGQYGTLFVDDQTREALVRQRVLVPAATEEGRYDLSQLTIGGIAAGPVSGIAVQKPPFAAAAPIGLTEANVLSLGYGFLCRYKTVWDYSRSKLYLLAP